MRAAVAKAWPAHCTKYEGRLAYMYLDTKNKVTCGTGNLIDSVAAAQALAWYRPDGKKATARDIEIEWQYVKSRTDLSRLSGRAYEKVSKLRLREDELDRLLYDTTARFWANLVDRWPVLDDAPADAQLAGLDLAWQNGYGFLELKQPNGSWTWPNMRASWQKGDWAKAALAVPDPHPDPGDNDQKDRAEARKRLFRNAAKVVAFGGDRDILWDTRTPEEDDMPTPQEVADAVLTRDGKIQNAFTGNPKNEYVSLATALTAIGKQLDEISAVLKTLVERP